MPTIAADARGGGLLRPDLLVHALAQLPDRTCLSLQADERDLGRLRALVTAYGLSERAALGSAGGGEDDLRIEPCAGSRERERSTGAGWTITGGDGEPRHASTLAELVEGLYQADDPPAATVRGADDRFEGHRIAVVTNVPNHYRVPLWNRVSERLQSAGGVMHVLFAGGDPRESRPWLRYPEPQFSHEFLRIRRIMGGTIAPVGLERALRRFNPHLVLAPGFSPFVTGRVARFAADTDVPFGIWSGETARQGTARSRSRRLQRRRLARRADFGLAYGWLAGEYLRGLSPSLPLVIGRNTAPVPDPAPTRAGGTGQVRFLAVAQAIPRKGLEVAVEAFRRLEGGACSLTVVGSGSQLEMLKGRAAGDDRIRFLGAVESDRVLDEFRAADAFLFPSRSDVFGLALVEAMGSGLPTITAAAPGAVPDLAVNGHNCLVVDDHDAAGWSATIRCLLEDSALRERLARNAQRTVSRRWTMEHSVDAWIASFRLALQVAED